MLGGILIIGGIFGFLFGLLHAGVWLLGAIAWIFLMIAAYLSPATFIGGRGSRYP